MATLRVGVVSDTHGRLFGDVVAALAGVERILHAGDVGRDVLAELSHVAPVVAVAGNTDPFELGLPDERLVEVGGVRLLLAHVAAAALRAHDPVREGIAALVTGHTHRAAIVWDGGVLHLNPGAAGPARFGYPRSLALLEIADGELRPSIVELAPGRA